MPWVVLVGLLAEAMALLAASRLLFLHRQSPWTAEKIRSLASRPLLRERLYELLAEHGEPWAQAAELSDTDNLGARDLWRMEWNHVLTHKAMIPNAAARIAWCATALAALLLIQVRMRHAAIDAPAPASLELYVLLAGAPGAIVCHIFAARARRETSALRAAVRALVPDERRPSRLARG